MNKSKNQGLYLPEFEHDSCGAGFISSLNGKRTNEIIHKALEILEKLAHRGAVSADGKTGDGAGILLDIPHEYFLRVCPFDLSERGNYAVGMTFLPQKENQRQHCIHLFEKNLNQQKLDIIGWRKVPVNPKILGEIARKTEPFIQQIFIAKNKLTEQAFKTKLFIARKRTEHQIYDSKLSQKASFYLPSFSNKTIIYKGLLLPQDIKIYYKDLQEKDVLTRLALVHQRFSTNTFPTWDLAQPFRQLCHNGEINTLRGNISQMLTREELLSNPLIENDLKSVLPIILEGRSDSATLDMVLELLLLTGRSLPEAMMMLIPEAWEKHQTMSKNKKAFYEYNSCIMEPWDGPASIPFTDGNYIGALLDRNGLRPSRYTITKSGYVIMSSETGVIDIDPENISHHGRLEPGKMFLVNMNEGRLVNDEEIKEKITSKYPYYEWLAQNTLHLADIPYTQCIIPNEKIDLNTRKKVFGYTYEDITKIIDPMAVSAKEPIGAMGTDTPLAVFSHQPQLLYNYFKQLFAQVTNPPLDGIREEIITDISLTLGAGHNLFDIHPAHCRKLRIQNPIISKYDLEKIKTYDNPYFKSIVIPFLYKVKQGLNGLEEALKNLVNTIDNAIDDNHTLIILSDRGTTEEQAPVPMLLACSWVHHSFQKRKKRSRFSMIIESAEPREVHHFALLFGYGASAINPYMVNEIIEERVRMGVIKLTAKEAIVNYNKAVGKGLVKIMNKIGISTLNSYRTSQIFEALGLNKKFINKYFPNTPTRIEGIGLYELEKEWYKNHKEAFEEELSGNIGLKIGGDYRWRRSGENHLFNPLTIAKLRQAVQKNEIKTYEEYSQLINNQSRQRMTIRGLLEFTNHDPIPIEEVEPWTEIVKRFKTGAMSYGSISQEAHETLAIAMNRLGGKSNSGEGGENPVRFYKDQNGDWRNSAIKQIASGRFGVSSNYLTNAKEIQIKMAQGAKPGEGGHLPGEKVYPWIAECRNSTPYVGLISPPPHHDIYSIEDLSQLIYDLKAANRQARINVKLVSETGVGTVAAGVAKAKADVILISGYDGGTGAAPLTSLRHAGLPWELGLAEAQQTLVMNNLRTRIVMECDGQLKTGRDVAIACLLGAEEFGFATAPLVTIGCVMMRACHLNTCPVGIATQNPVLRAKFEGEPEHVVNFMYYVAEELRQIMAQLGFRSINEMVGQVKKLEITKAVNYYKTTGIDLSAILHCPKADKNTQLYHTIDQNHELDNHIDFTILQQAHPAIFRKEETTLYFNISNTDRSVGAILSNEISKIYAQEGLPEDTLKLYFKGSAGQSFGAFSTRGLRLTIEGNANDYIGKGLSGAKIIVKVPQTATLVSHENIIIGNVALYGATAGEAYFNGIAGERFAVRNSGADAVVEGIGDHGCEYMTGGTVIVLGETGRNFAAGMSGGIVYVYDPNKNFKENCNPETIDFEKITVEKDIKILRTLIEKHFKYTNSKIAEDILNRWELSVKNFVKVIPTEYKQALERLANEEKIIQTA